MTLQRTLGVLGLLWWLVLPAWAELPYARHGWDKREAAAHLLARFTFGAQPGEVESVAEQGLEVWLEQQLTASFPETELQGKLAQLPETYRMSNQQIIAEYPLPFQLKAQARRQGQGEMDRRELMRQARQDGARPPRELGSTLLAQKLYHARYGQAQLREVMTEFWFNHFNVATSNNRARRFLLSYERDALRPNALAPFRKLLGQTAKHPAMLWYLDNATSTAAANPARPGKPARRKGLNENYARELLELHTLGVDGGYTQTDVTETARVLTGWTAVPYERPDQLRRAEKAGSRHLRQGDFLFAGELHDAGAKTVLGQSFPAGGGLEEGERLLDLAAAHPSTARHLARKLAVRFVNDQPSEALVDKLADVFLQTGGDSKAMLRAIARSDEFWLQKQRGSKVKSPLEVVVSASRILGAELQPTPELYEWLCDMGQPLYNYMAPTGFPDQADAWVSSGTVLARVNFGMKAGQGQVLGFSYPLQVRPDLKAVVTALLPAQNPAPILEKLEPLLGGAADLSLDKPAKPDKREKQNLGGRLPGLQVKPMKVLPQQRKTATMIGLVLGSPEFQRR